MGEKSVYADGLYVKKTQTSSPVDKATGALLYTLASTATKVSPGHLRLLAKEIALGNLKSSEQISAGIQYAESIDKKGSEWNKSELENAAGVGTRGLFCLSVNSHTLL